MNTQPKLSIITVVYNAAGLIERTVKSVLEQNYSNIEFVVVDGASSDGTLEILEKYSSRIAVLESGKDKGIYDAMNKGLKLATGDYVLFLNAGDELDTADTISSVFSVRANADAYYGNTRVVDERGTVLADRRLSPPAHMNWKSLRYGMCVSHQSFLVKRLLCDFYNTDYRISADIDWVINALKQCDSIVNTHRYISRFLEGGTSGKRRKTALLERFRIMVQHYGLFPTIWNHVYILFRWPFHRLSRKSMT